MSEEEKKNLPKVTPELLKRVFSYLTPYWKQLALTLLCIVFSSIMTLLPSILTGKIIDEGLIDGWGLSQVGVDTISRAQVVTPLSAVQNIYSMVERDVEREVIPYCAEHKTEWQARYAEIRDRR